MSVVDQDERSWRCRNRPTRIGGALPRPVRPSRAGVVSACAATPGTVCWGQGHPRDHLTATVYRWCSRWRRPTPRH